MLRGQTILIAEDNVLLSMELAAAVLDSGAQLLGPVASVGEAFRVIAGARRPINLAILDVNLGRDPVYPVADALTERNIPFVFLTGDLHLKVPDHFLNATVYYKPVNPQLLMKRLRFDVLKRKGWQF